MKSTSKKYQLSMARDILGHNVKHLESLKGLWGHLCLGIHNWSQPFNSVWGVFTFSNFHLANFCHQWELPILCRSDDPTVNSMKRMKYVQFEWNVNFLLLQASSSAASILPSGLRSSSNNSDSTNLLHQLSNAAANSNNSSVDKSDKGK